MAEREYRLLLELDERLVPVVEAVGVATGRADAQQTPLDAVLITRHLDFSLPYRALFARASRQELWNPLLDAMAELLVRLHLAGFFWGDCSLSNTLFRRDAGELAATLVDAETGELHPSLSDGQRAHDLADRRAERGRRAAWTSPSVPAGRTRWTWRRWPKTSSGATRACGPSSPERR